MPKEILESSQHVLRNEINYVQCINVEQLNWALSWF